MASNYSNVVDIISRVTAKAQADDNYKTQYVGNPTQTLKEAGLDVPNGVRFHVITGTVSASEVPPSTASDIYLLFPTVKERVEDESLATAASASCQSTSSTCLTIPSCISSASSASTNSCS